jgi:hypothetical protein
VRVWEAAAREEKCDVALGDGGAGVSEERRSEWRRRLEMVMGSKSAGVDGAPRRRAGGKLLHAMVVVKHWSDGHGTSRTV